jgi:outer membrane lipoprotein LolB
MKSRKIYFLLIFIISILFLAGCAHVAPPKHINWKKQQAKLQQIKNWEIAGVLSITSNNKRNTAYFSWKQDVNNYLLDVSGPMNLNRTKIIGNQDKVEFCRSDNDCIQAKTPEQLFFNQFGWRLPVSDMRYWILAILSPASPVKATELQYNQDGYLLSFAQHGWKVNYSEFQAFEDNIILPSMINLQYKNIYIKLKIKNISLFHVI